MYHLLRTLNSYIAHCVMQSDEEELKHQNDSSSYDWTVVQYNDFKYGTHDAIEVEVIRYGHGTTYRRYVHYVQIDHGSNGNSTVGFSTYRLTREP